MQDFPPPSYDSTVSPNGPPPVSYVGAMQPQAMTTTQTVVTSRELQQWQTGLCDLCSDGVGGCLYAFCFPHFAFASARTAYDGSNCCLNFCCGSPVLLYNIIREGYHIEGTCCCDLCIVYWCLPCAAVRMKGEVNKRGRNPNTVTVQTSTQQMNY